MEHRKTLADERILIVQRESDSGWSARIDGQSDFPQAEKLGTQKWFFLFTLWVPRAMENFLLAVMSRILKEEVRIG